jgi:hypothetical protein
MTQSMASDHPRPVGVHLVGSVPLENAAAVFSTVTSIVGDQVRRIPDGETGSRTDWVEWQFGVFNQHPDCEFVPPDPTRYASVPHFRVHAGDELEFPKLGYADAAKASYAEFARMKEAGQIPPTTRFQVSLPTPLAPVVVFVAPLDHAKAEPAYERALLAELDEITAAIPHGELAIQWDVAVEFGILEGVFPSQLRDDHAGIVERLVKLGNRVPAEVELGYHLCYGDRGHKHFKEPEDTSKLLAIANAVSAGVERAIQWIHLPVPRERTDDAYFAPLRELKLQPGTELYLGLVHLTDGVEGRQRRIEAAQRVVTHFGIGTECGLGRRPSETIPDVLRIHAQVAEPVRV